MNRKGCSTIQSGVRFTSAWAFKERALRRTYLLAIVAALSSMASASAHHSLTQYARSTSVTIEGTVEYYRWANPHVRIGVRTITPEGTIKLWDIESGSVGTLSSAGLTGKTLAVGDKITASFYPRKDDVPTGFLISLTTADGHTFDPNRKGRRTRGTKFEF